LQAHNPEINWETGEVKMMRCSLLCGRNTKLEKGQKVKNNYPLPLITDLIDNMGSKQVFTKMDLQ